MASKRVYEAAKEFHISSEAFLKIVRELRFEAKSHMSVATDDMVAAVRRKFDIEKENAKKQLEHKKKIARRAAQEASAKERAKSHGLGSLSNQISSAPKTAGTSGTKAPTTDRPRAPQPPGRGGFRPGGQQRGRKRRDRKSRNRNVDQAAVSKSFRSTMASLAGTQKTKKYRRRGASDGELIDVQNIVAVTEFMTIGDLAKTLEIKPAELIGKMLQLGHMATINQRLDIDSIEMLCLEFEFGIEQKAEVGEAAKQEETEVEMVKRPPVVTVMGHVDHGKTSLLDYIRQTDVVAGESGAITQHIGAYQITIDGGEQITFLDTPGHEAFTAMRSRGAQVTDVVILVVAADDGVMPQTIEAINHAKAAAAPIIVAINKIDKPEANIDRIKQELSGQGLNPEEWGGDTVMVPISAKTGEGIDKLLEMLVVTAELLELKADPNIRAQGIVIEAKLEKGRGPVSTILVTKGSARIGNAMVAGSTFGRVRSLHDDRGANIEMVGPGSPAQITGLNGVPQAGDSFLVVTGDSEAREISSKRSQIKREYDFRRPRKPTTLENLFEGLKDGEVKELNVVLKGDVDGSVEALVGTLTSIASDEVRVRIVHSAVGAVTESDVLLASTSNAIIIGFHVGPTPRAREVAAKEKIDIRHYEIIYEVEDDVRKALEGLLAPSLEEKFTGLAEVRDVFKAPKVGLIAGCYVRDGSIKRSHKVNLMRDGRKIYTGNIDSLRRFKDDVREVQVGYECGIHIERFNDVKVGDVIEAFEIIEVARKLQES